MEPAAVEELNFLTELTQTYIDKANVTGHWADYLKAHGLSNACSVRDPTSVERRKQIYDIENAWYNDNHPLNYKEYKELTTRHKEVLQNYREKTRESLETLDISENVLNVNSIFSSIGLSQALSLSSEVFKISEKCAAGFVDISKSIIESSVDLLRRSGQEAPRPFAVIGLGSVARGEATPYSDLEYAFVVDSRSDDPYFVDLAVDSYFRIGNLGETPLKCFDIKELKSKTLSNTTIGFKIDGISDKAGNIPTGSPGGQRLILTVDELLEVFSREMLTPMGDFPGDLSDLLASSVLVYRHKGGRAIYDRLIEKVTDVMDSAASNPMVNRKRLDTIKVDIGKHNFSPRQKSFGPPDNFNVKVKTDIFRYPTLLANHFKLALRLKSNFPWDTFHSLEDLGTLSTESCNYMLIVLALSIYIRLSSYIALGTQLDKLSFYVPSSQSVSDVYHVPRNLFIVLGFLSSQMKSSIEMNLQNSDFTGLDMSSVVCQLLKYITISQENYMLKVEVISFTGDYNRALEMLYRGAGEASVDELSRDLMQTFEENQSVKSSLEMCCFLLWSAGKFHHTRKYLEALIKEEGSELPKLRWKILLAECHNKIHLYTDASEVLNDVIIHLKREAKLESHQPLQDHVTKLHSDQSVSLLEITAHAYRTIGETYSGLKLFGEAEEVFHNSVNLYQLMVFHQGGDELSRFQANVLMSLSNIYINQGHYQKACKCLERSEHIIQVLYGKGANHHDLALCYNGMGRLHMLTGDYQSSLKCLGKSLSITQTIHKQEPHYGMIENLCDTGNVYFALGDYKKSLEKYKSALDIVHLVRSETHGFDIAKIHTAVGRVYSKLNQFEDSLKELKMASDIIAQTYPVSCNHLVVAAIFSDFAKVHMAAGNYRDSAQYSEKAHEIIYGYYEEGSQNQLISNLLPNMAEYTRSLQLETTKLNVHLSVHGRQKAHPDIARCYEELGGLYREMGQHNISLEYHIKSLDMRKCLYGDEAEHPEIASSLGNVGSAHKNLAQYAESMRFCQISLKMRQTLYGSSADHPDICESYESIGDVCCCVGDFQKALRNHIKALDSRMAIYRIETNHPDIASSYSKVGKVHHKLGDYAASLGYHEKSLNIKRLLYGTENHADIARSHMDVALVYRAQGLYEKSLDSCKIVLDIVHVTYGEHSSHPQIAECLELIGNVYSAIGEYKKSLVYYTRSLEMHKAVYGTEAIHPDVADNYSSIGGVYDDMGEYTRALEYYTKSLEMKKAVYGEDTVHPNIANSYYSIGGVSTGNSRFLKGGGNSRF